MAYDFVNLVVMAKNGDKDAFAELYKIVYRELYRYAYFSLKNKQDAEDAINEAAMDAFTEIKSLRNERAFKSWFYKIVIAKCNKCIRRKMLNEEPLNENLQSQPQNCEISLDLQNAINLLNHRERQIVALSAFSGYSLKEVSELLFMNSNTVRSTYNRALVKLKEILS